MAYDYINDTIVAISTTVGRGAISIVRVSGDRALSVLEKVYYNPKLDLSSIRARYLYYGEFREPNTNRFIDEVLVVYMKNPSSFTGEDTIEIQCHGGELVPYNVLKVILSLGFVRLALAGEFTRRAYLNSRIDLTQAEAINDIITARSQFELQSATSSLRRRFSDIIRTLRKRLLHVLASLEVHIDYPEEDIDIPLYNDFVSTIEDILLRLESLLADSRQGSLIREGIRLVIVGSTNVGKSSLFNYLIRDDRAIVSSIHGTTRDFIEARISLEGLPIELIDTAGFRKTDDEIELIGMERAYKKIKETDYILWVLDQSVLFSDDDAIVLSFLENEAIDKDKLIVVINKCDLKRALDYSFLEDKGRSLFRVSTYNSNGLRELEEGIRKTVVSNNKGSFNRDAILFNIRQENLITLAKGSLENTLSLLKDKGSYELIALEIRQSLSYFDEVVGDVTLASHVIDHIFSNFCVGK